MPSLSSAHQLLSTSHWLLANAMEVEPPVGQDYVDAVEAALRDLYALWDKLRTLQPDYWRVVMASRDDVAANRLFIEHMQRATELEAEERLDEAVAVWQDYLATRRPDLHHSFATLEINRLEVNIEEALPDGPLDEAGQAMVAALSPSQVDEIDEALLAEAKPHWQKVAKIVGTVMARADHRLVAPDVFYAQRVARLVELGKLKAEGDLGRMRFSEVRLPFRLHGE